jgi:DNA (cytosine-5)-methyltransferase 1
MNHKFNYEWYLKDGYPAKGVDYHGSKVFSCFACGGGSTMGYKLAGYDVIGMNEIDPKMAECYIENHNPKYAFIEPIQEFKNREELPRELYNLDILDGSPPCSSFSMAGNREKDWGKEKKFREGQSKQVLDTLFFDFIDLAKRLQPKVVIAENVKGLLMGDARGYLGKIGAAFGEAGYKFDYKLLNASHMGVPQRRERVFFYAIRNDLIDKIDTSDLFGEVPHLDLTFYEKEVLFSEIMDEQGEPITDYKKEAWMHRKETDNGIADSKANANMKVSDFNHVYLFKHKVMSTIIAKGEHAMSLFHKPIKPSEGELKKGGTYPLDYNFKSSKAGYLIGMSVPPVMTAQIADRVYNQWLKKVNL